ncbi:MAG TPA: hypothetical protein VGA33_04635, partial [Thermoanaerobaculia bacterium]
LYVGRGGEPEVVIHTLGAHTTSMNTFDVDLGRWPRKGYVIDRTFSADDMPPVDQWLRMELRCE